MRLALLALVLAFPAGARAGTIELHHDAANPEGIDYYVFTAAPGERNEIAVQRVPGGLRVTDAAGAPAGCAPDGPGAVRCERELNLFVDAGDGDDVVTGDDAMIDASGGPGNDRLTTTDPVSAWLEGGGGDDVLTGGPGMDTIQGGPGADRISAGPGNDLLHMGFDDDSADVVDGGDGEDTVSYEGRDRPVTVDLAAHTGAGNDTYANIENATGGSGRDTLEGDDGANVLEGGGRLDGRGGDDRLQGSKSDDILTGGAGSDSLTGESGDDRYDGGPGDDRLWFESARRPDARCGAGTDTAFVFNHNGPLLHRDCERVEAEGALIRIHRTRLSVRWDTRAFKRPCRLRVGTTTIHKPSPRHAATVRLPPGLVTVHPSSRCSGRLGSAYTPTAFRLTS